MTPRHSSAPELSSERALLWSQHDFSEKKAVAQKTLQNVQVRTPKQISGEILSFFKMNAKTRQPLSKTEQIFHAQVCMHEIDEGLRILEKIGAPELKNLQDFHQKIHLSQRLEILRQKLNEGGFCHLPPDAFHGACKIRNNQWGYSRVKFANTQVVALTDKGIGYKDCNEDAFLLMPQHNILALADGMGGHLGGNIASGIAIDFFEYGISQHMSLAQAIVFANEAILLRTQNDPQFGGSRPMGCTFVTAQISPKGLLKVAHVGDSKALVLRKGEIVFQTQDHTQGQQLKREGLVDFPTAFELNHILNRCLGIDSMQAKRDVDLTEFSLQAGDRVILITDGISDNFFDSQFHLGAMAKIVARRSLEHSIQVLTETCRKFMESKKLPSGRPAKSDNFSVAAFEYMT